MINSKDISVIIDSFNNKQELSICLTSIKKYLPNAQIILSTWENTDIEGFVFDEVVHSFNPGTSDLIREFPFKELNDINRQIVSAREGIKRANRKYVLKICSDMFLIGNGFLQYYCYFINTKAKNSIFKQRILIDAKSTFLGGLFNMSSRWFFGLKEDMLLLWDVKLYPNKLGDEYFLKRENSKKQPYGLGYTCQFLPEQWRLYQCLLKKQNMQMEHAFDNSEQNIKISDHFIMDNFLTIEPCFSDIVNPKAKQIIKAIASSTYYNYKKQLKNLSEFEIKIPLLKQIQYNIIYRINEIKEDSPLLPVYKARSFAKPKDLKEINVDKIKQKDVTFVVSGLVNKNSAKNLKALRKYYPKSKIILSIQTGLDIDNLKGLYDKLVETPIQDNYFLDKYAYLPSSDTQVITYNKQQNEIRNGLLNVDTKYAVRYRLDLKIKNSKLLQYYEKFSKIYSKTLEEYQIFDQKVLVPDFLTGNLYSNKFFVSDTFAFGLTSDLLKLFNAKFMDEQIVDFFNKPENKDLPNPFLLIPRYTCEQFLFFSLLEYMKRPFDLPKTYCEYTTEQVMLYEKYLTSNFMVFSFKKFGINTRWDLWSYESTEVRFIERYMLNVDPFNKFDKLYLDNVKWYSCHNYENIIKKHIKKLIVPNQKISRYLGELFSLAFYNTSLFIQKGILLFK